MYYSLCIFRSSVSVFGFAGNWIMSGVTELLVWNEIRVCGFGLVTLANVVPSLLRHVIEGRWRIRGIVRATSQANPRLQVAGQ
jgi:hypothetical protein